MAKTILTNARLFAVGLDVTSQSNEVSLTSEVEDKDTTTYGSNGWTEVVGGLRSAEVMAKGFWEAGSADLVDDATWAALGAAAGSLTVAPVGAADGALAYVGQVMQMAYRVGDAVGEVAPWELSGHGHGTIGRGVIAHPPGTARAASGVGTSINLGAVAAGQRLIAAVHVLSVSSTLSITPRIETDTATGFPSATTPTGLTGTAATNANSPQGQFLSSDGSALTDTWQRAAWTTSGSGSALFVVAIAIV
jgi:hypothetical protein